MKRLLDLFRRDATRPHLKQIRAIGLKPGDVAIDCGANVGVVTACLAESGATVYAFEPNREAHAILAQRFAGQPNVHCLQKGVLDEPGRARLYLHEQAAHDPVRWSTGSSLVEAKANISREHYLDIDVVDLCAFIVSLGCRVRVLKLDVEGVECRLLRQLIRTGVIHLIDHVWVETHDQKIPSLREETDELRRLLQDNNLRHVRLDWV